VNALRGKDEIIIPSLLIFLVCVTHKYLPVQSIACVRAVHVALLYLYECVSGSSTGHIGVDSHHNISHDLGQGLTNWLMCRCLLVNGYLSGKHC